MNPTGTEARGSLLSAEELKGREKLPNVHPGDVLREDFLLPMGMTPYRLAKRMKMDQTAIGEILAGRRGITANTALRLSRLFGTTAHFWLNLQAAYDLEEEREKRSQEIQSIEPLEISAAQLNAAF
jgi:addiction module HigA family antidote